MASFKVFADSTGDLGVDLLKKYDIDYFQMNYVIDDKEYPATLEWESHTPKEFYDFMRNGKHITTTQVPRERYEEKFTAALENGQDVVYISCSSALSGSVNLAKLIAKELKAKYPNNTVYCVDSLISSLGQGYLAIVAANMRDEGKSADETASYIESIKLKENQLATVGSLEYLRRAGRVKASSAFFGNLFGVKPILISDAIGQNYAVKKVKGALNAIKDIAASVAELVENPEEQTLYISHADCVATAERVRDEIMKICPFKDCYISYIGPIVGASVGPETIGVYFFGKEVTTEGRD